MAKLTNTTRKAIMLGTGHVVPAGGALEVGNEVIDHTDNAAFVCAQEMSGFLVVERDAEKPTKAEIMRMGRDDLKIQIEERGGKLPKQQTIANLRKAAMQVIHGGV